jgi:hypothetical protein
LAIEVVDAAKAARLAAPDHPEAMARELRWQVRHASLAVRAILCRLPTPMRSGGELGVLIGEMHTALMNTD